MIILEMRFAGVINVNSDYSMSSGAGMSSDTGMRSNVGMNSDVHENIASVLEGVPGEKYKKCMQWSLASWQENEIERIWSALLAEDLLNIKFRKNYNKQQSWTH